MPIPLIPFDGRTSVGVWIMDGSPRSRLCLLCLSTIEHGTFYRDHKQLGVSVHSDCYDRYANECARSICDVRPDGDSDILYRGVLASVAASYHWPVMAA